jgi:hypothetical protein
MWGALSDDRMHLMFTIAAGPRQRSHYRVRVPRGSDSRLAPNPEGQVPAFLTSMNRVVQLNPQALGNRSKQLSAYLTGNTPVSIATANRLMNGV